MPASVPASTRGPGLVGVAMEMVLQATMSMGSQDDQLQASVVHVVVSRGLRLS